MRPPRSIDPNILAASESFSMGCVGLSKRKGGTAPTRNVEEIEGLESGDVTVLNIDWATVG